MHTTSTPRETRIGFLGFLISGNFCACSPDVSDREDAGVSAARSDSFFSDVVFPSRACIFSSSADGSGFALTVSCGIFSAFSSFEWFWFSKCSIFSSIGFRLWISGSFYHDTAVVPALFHSSACFMIDRKRLRISCKRRSLLIFHLISIVFRRQIASYH